MILLIIGGWQYCPDDVMPLKPLDNESELLARIATGDQFAFTEIFNHYHNPVYRFAFRLLQDNIQSQEIVQEAMLHIWQLGEKLNTIESLEGYLKTFAKRRSIAVFRHNAVRVRAEKIMADGATEGSNETEESVLVRETKKILEEGVSLLPAQQQQVYQLCREQGLSYEQAAELMGISKGTVHSHMKLALKFLRQHVEQSTYIPVMAIILKLF